jgi:hypothetical protein
MEEHPELQKLWARYRRIYRALNLIGGKVTEPKYKAVQRALMRTLREIAEFEKHNP